MHYLQGLANYALFKELVKICRNQVCPKGLQSVEFVVANHSFLNSLALCPHFLGINVSDERC